MGGGRRRCKGRVGVGVFPVNNFRHTSDKKEQHGKKQEQNVGHARNILAIGDISGKEGGANEHRERGSDPSKVDFF